jgi:hypothetical protein
MQNLPANQSAEVSPRAVFCITFNAEIYGYGREVFLKPISRSEMKNNSHFSSHHAGRRWDKLTPLLFSTLTSNKIRGPALEPLSSVPWPGAVPTGTVTTLLPNVTYPNLNSPNSFKLHKRVYYRKRNGIAQFCYEHVSKRCGEAKSIST